MVAQEKTTSTQSRSEKVEETSQWRNKDTWELISKNETEGEKFQTKEAAHTQTLGEQ